MRYFTQEDISKVKQLDLYTYLKNYDPDELVHFSRNTYVTKDHDSLKISNGMWYWFSQNIGGKTALDYLMRVKGYSFTGAVEHLLKCLEVKPTIEKRAIIKKRINKLVLPKRNINNDTVINYLLKRGIDKDIIDYCIYNELIYEDINNNVVFVGGDYNSIIRYAGLRGTKNVRYLKDAYGSDKKYSFRINAVENSDTVHVFESVIDLLSYATLLKGDNKDWRRDTLISLAGVYSPSKNIEDSKAPSTLTAYLDHYKDIKKIVLHLDNDAAGISSARAIKIALSPFYEVINDPPLYGKDYNDYLLRTLQDNTLKKINGRDRI